MSARLEKALHDYAWNAQQAAQLELADEQNLDITPMVNPRFDWEQLKEIRLCLKDGVDPEPLLDPDLPSESMKKLRRSLFEQNAIYDERHEAVERKRLKRIIITFVAAAFIVTTLTAAYWKRETIRLLFARMDLELVGKEATIGTSELSHIDYMRFIRHYDHQYRLTLPKNRISTVGSYQLEYGLSNEVKTTHRYIILRVRDDEAPALKLKENSLTMTEGDSFNAMDHVRSANDNIDGNVMSRVKASGGIDTSRTGSYRIDYEVSDKAGNKSHEQLSVSVQPKPQPQPQSNPQVQAQQGSRKTVQEAPSRKAERSVQQGSTAKAGTPSVSSGSLRTTAQPRTFSFSTSSDMNATYRNAIAYAQQEMNAGRARSYNVTPIQGPDGIYTGYRVTFS